MEGQSQKTLTNTRQFKIDADVGSGVLILKVVNGSLHIDHTIGSETPESIASIIHAFVLTCTDEDAYRKFIENARNVEEKAQAKISQEAEAQASGEQGPQTPA